MTRRIKKTVVHYIEISWKIFLNGLFAILPVTLTFALFGFSLKLLKSWLEPVYRLEPASLQRIPGSEIFLVILAIFLVGIILRFLILRSLVHWVESLIFKIPLIRPIYAGIKQLVHAFSVQDKISFQSVVLVEFPRTGMYSLGFLTSEMAPAIAPKTEKRFFNVFVPTTPNPTSGFFIMVAEDELSYIDLSRQEAMALIISGGIIQPDRFTKKN